MLVLGLDTASGGCAACVTKDGAVLAEEHMRAEQGLAGLIPLMLARLIAQAGMPGLIAVIVGPGSFTGLRAGIAVARGIGLAAGIDVVGVTAAQAWGGLADTVGDRALWTAIGGRRGRVFIDSGGGFASHDVMALPLPLPRGAVAIAGDARNAVASVLASRGVDVMLTSASRPRASDIASAGLRLSLEGGPHPATPLYVEEPEARLPAGGLRPAPLPYATSA